MSSETLADELQRLMRSADVRAIDLANRTGFSQSKISKILNGGSIPRESDLTRLADSLNASDEDRAALLVLHTYEAGQRASRRSHRRGADDDRVAEMERRANHVSVYAQALVPPHLQIPAYTEALVRRVSNLHPQKAVRREVAQRIERQLGRQLELGRGGDFDFFLREACLDPGTWCPSEIMAIQRDYLASWAGQPDSENVRVGIHIVDSKVDDELAPNIVDFALLDFDTSAAVVVETYALTTYIDDQQITSQYDLELTKIRAESSPFADWVTCHGPR